ncbi:MAG: glycosyltransferase family 2 protein [Bacteroidaceae bacterium]|nr:glycosyltransferase family 2 protein [Bacteroidaceae bacterium]MBP5646601.1 glycosyltransferase family 2 protein [Bacteroidaceae bacterium]
MTAIILINWNGADDTIDCLESLDKAHGSFMVVVADNGSTDDSLERIEHVIPELSIKVELLPLGHNWGFAAGNNKAIEYAGRFNPDSYMLLNNDTVVEPDFLVRLNEYREQRPDIRILGPMVCYWSDRNRIWSCGAHLSFGTRRALYRDATTDVLESRKPIEVSFISGCALFADASLIEKGSGLLSERFFFGEEDFEFAHRMRSRGEKMAIIPDSVIYHKVGSSAKKMSGRAKLGRDYIYYLGRLIVVREYYCPFSTVLIRFLTRHRCQRYFIQDGLDRRTARKLTGRLMYDAMHKDGISYDDFRSIVIDGSFFDNF